MVNGTSGLIDLYFTKLENVLEIARVLLSSGHEVKITKLQENGDHWQVWYKRIF